MDRITGKTTTLTIGGATAASVVLSEHPHSHWHPDGTYHTHDHSALNLTHHGNPALAMKVAAAAGGGGGGEVDGDLDGYTTSQGDVWIAVITVPLTVTQQVKGTVMTAIQTSILE